MVRIAISQQIASALAELSDWEEFYGDGDWEFGTEQWVVVGYGEAATLHANSDATAERLLDNAISAVKEWDDLDGTAL